MLTVILTVTSDSTDIEYYKNAVGNSATLYTVPVSDSALDEKPTTTEPPATIEQYNKIIEESDAKSDIMLLSDQIDLHGDFDKFIENMQNCLYVTEKHAIVYGQEIENRDSLLKTAKKYLPRYSVNIDDGAFCVLIKRNVLDLLGLFDTEYKSIGYALRDFYYSINQYGYSSVTAHQSLYSFNDNKNDYKCAVDKEMLISKFPYVDTNEFRYTQNQNPLIKFLRLFDEDYYQKKRILFDCRIMPTHHCGTSEYQISLYNAFYSLYKDKYDVFLLVTRHADEFHKLSDRLENVIYPDTLKGEFHIGFAPNQLNFLEGQAPLVMHCYKIVQTVYDIIMLRVDEFFSKDSLEVGRANDVDFGIRLSDGIVFISDYTKSDFLSSFNHVSDLSKKKMRVIYPAAGIHTPQNTDYELPFTEYYLIVGNNSKHKAIENTVEAVRNLRHNFIVVGGDVSHNAPNIHSYKSGHLDEDFLSYIYSSCKAIIFPSLYEGFGLPIVIGFKFGKHVIVNNNSLNKELRNHFKQFSEQLLFFDHFKEIGSLIENLDFSNDLKTVAYNDSWEKVATEYEEFFNQLLDEDIDIDSFSERYRLLGRFDSLIAHRDTEIQRRDSMINERDNLIHERDAVIHERDAVIHERNAVIHERNVEIHRCHNELEIAIKQYNDIQNAFWWRFTKPARLLTDKIRGRQKEGIADKSSNKAKKKSKPRKSRQKSKIIPKNLHIRSSKVLRAERKHRFSVNPLFSICVPLYNTPEEYLTDMITSVINQSYTNWELIIADGSTENRVADYCNKFTESKSRIRYIKLAHNKGISENTNEAIKSAIGDYIGFMDHDDILHPSLLFELAKTIEAEDADFIYTDEAVINETIDDIAYLKLKADFSIYELRAHNYICHFVACKRSLLDSVGYLRKQFDGSQDHDMNLRLIEKAQKVVHIPQILYYWRMHKDSVAYSIDVKGYAVKSAIAAIGEHLERCGVKGDVDSSHPHKTIYKVRYYILQYPQVTVVIHGADCNKQIEHCISNIYRNSGYFNFKILTTNSSINEPISQVREGEYLLFIDASFSRATQGFIGEMLMYLQQSDVGAVSPLVLYDDGTIHNAGISLFSQSKSGLNYWYHGEDSENGGYELINRHVRETTGAWAGCMMVRGDIFKEVGGFNDSPESYEGIDFCLKIRQKGLVTVWTPYASIHFDIAEHKIARGKKITSTNEFKKKWKSEYKKSDPHYHRLFYKLEII